MASDRARELSLYETPAETATQAMTKQPCVTVVTPFLNAAAHIGEAVASVQAQTITDWELILVDDGSTDDSASIAQMFSERDSRIKLLHRPSGSLHSAAAARNAGMRAGKGMFFAFLDADDVFEPHMLATVLAAADANPSAAMIFGPTQWWYPDGSRANWVEPTDGLGGRLHQPPELLWRIVLMQDGHVPCTCSVLVRRSAIDATGGFEERFQLYEDQALWTKLLLRYPAYVTPACLSRYRQHSDSESATAASQGLYDRMGEHPARAPFLSWLADYVAGSGVRDARLDRALRLARAPYADPKTIQTKADRLLLRAYLRLGTYRRRIRRKLARIRGSHHDQTSA
jgi:GT2 family glycosyltransferase